MKTKFLTFQSFKPIKMALERYRNIPKNVAYTKSENYMAQLSILDFNTSTLFVSLVLFNPQIVIFLTSAESGTFQNATAIDAEQLSVEDTLSKLQLIPIKYQKLPIKTNLLFTEFHSIHIFQPPWFLCKIDILYLV